MHDEIAQYIEHFHEQHAKLSQVAEPLHRKILAVTLMSALAEGRYSGKKLRYVEKFVALVETYAPSWTHAPLVSVYMMHQAVQDGEPGITTAFAADVARRCVEWDRGRGHRTVGLENNPTLDAVLACAQSKEDRRLAADMKHSALLYHARCKLVHEFRAPGDGWEFDDTDHEPVYRFDPRELVYPVNWMLGLIPEIIAGLETYYNSDAINPYNSYRFGSPWRN